MKMKLLICEPLEKEVVAKLKENFEVSEGYKLDEGALAERIKDFEIVIVRSNTKITRRVMDAAGKKLKIIGRPGVGLDNIDLKAAAERGIKVLNTPEAPAASVAELVLGLMLCLSRKITTADNGMKNGKWLKSETKGRELFGKTLGLVGFGHIGSHIAKIATAAGMNVLAHDKYRKDAGEGVKLVGLEELLGASDFVSLHVPLTDETRHLLSGEKIAMMKPSAFLINTSRGGVVDEDALCKALGEKRIAGAGLDVFSTEPYSGPLTGLDNVVLTPHIGASTDEAQLRAGMMLAEKIAIQAASL